MNLGARGGRRVGESDRRVPLSENHPARGTDPEDGGKIKIGFRPEGLDVVDEASRVPSPSRLTSSRNSAPTRLRLRPPGRRRAW